MFPLEPFKCLSESRRDKPSFNSHGEEKMKNVFSSGINRNLKFAFFFFF